MSSFGAAPATRALLDAWVQNLSQVVESMTDQRPPVAWREVTGSAASLGLSPGPDVASWLHKLHCPQEAEVWVTVPRQTWEYLGSLTLKAAGLESSDPAEIKSTWLEILGQWQSALTRALSSHLGHDVTGEGGGESACEVQDDWLLVSLRFGEMELPPLGVVFGPALLGVLAAPPPRSEPEQPPAARDRDLSGNGSEHAPPSKTLDLLLDLELPVSISFGKTQLPLKDILKLTTGSIVELNRGISEPVEVLINHCLVARGEVVVVEGNYGVRIQQIASRMDRLRSIR
jgi:flagellar motor switch protein FliN/FliY